MADILPPAPVDAPFASYNWSDWYKKVRDAINAGATVSWNALVNKPTTVATSGLTDLSSGTYTPTLTGVTNVDATTAYVCQYLRVGSTVHVSGALNIDPTAAGDTVVGISLPIVSGLANSENLGGTTVCNGVAQYGLLFGDAGNDRASLRFIATDVAARDFWFTFTYRVL